MTDNHAPAGAQERCGAITTLGGAFPPMACTLPAGHRGAHDADSAIPVSQLQTDREALLRDLRDAVHYLEQWGALGMARAVDDATALLASPAEASEPRPAQRYDRDGDWITRDGERKYLVPRCPAQGDHLWKVTADGPDAIVCARCGVPADSQCQPRPERPAQGEAEPDAWILEALFEHGWMPGRPYRDREAAERVASEWAHRTVRVVPLYRRAERAEPDGALREEYNRRRFMQYMGRYLGRGWTEEDGYFVVFHSVQSPR